MTSKSIKIQTNFLEQQDGQLSDNIDTHKNTDHYYNLIESETYENQSDVYQRFHQQDKAVIMIQNSLETHLLTAKIVGFNSIKKSNIERRKFGNTITSGYQHRNMELEHSIDGHSLSNHNNQIINRSNAHLEGQRRPNRLGIQPYNSPKSQIKIKQSSLDEHAGQGDNLNQKIHRLQNLIGNIRKEKESHKSKIIYQRHKIENPNDFQDSGKMPGYVVFMMDQMKKLRTDIMEIKQINQSILKQSRALSLRQKSRDKCNTDLYSDQQGEPDTKLSFNFLRNRTQKKIHNKIQKNNPGHMSDRNNMQNIPQNTRLMKNHTINHMKEEYSARVNDLKRHLEQNSKEKYYVKDNKSTSRPVNFRESSNQHANHSNSHRKKQVPQKLVKPTNIQPIKKRQLQRSPYHKPINQEYQKNLVNGPRTIFNQSHITYPQPYPHPQIHYKPQYPPQNYQINNQQIKNPNNNYKPTSVTFNTHYQQPNNAVYYNRDSNSRNSTNSIGVNYQPAYRPNNQYMYN